MGKNLHDIAVTVRHAPVMDEEESRLFEDVGRTVEILREAGVVESDLARIKHLLTTASTTTNVEEILQFLKE